MFKKITLTVLILLLVAPTFAAKKIGGVNLPDKHEVAGTELVLNGAGLRKKLFIKVYAGGLYLKSKSKDAAAIVAADEPMIVRMHFIYDGVSAEKLIGAWNEGFAAVSGGNTASMQKEIDAFNALFTEEAKNGDVYEIVYEPGKGTHVKFNDKVIGTVEGHEFKKAVFGIWLGKQPADAKLKKGMLG